MFGYFLLRTFLYIFGILIIFYIKIYIFIIYNLKKIILKH